MCKRLKWKIIDEIFAKWNKDYEDQYVTMLCNTDHIRQGTYLHSFYKPEKDMPKLFKKQGWYLPKDLKEFYSKFNGIRLFFSSFSIYGMQSNRFFTDNVPYDLSIENFSRNKDKSYVVFGSICGCYYFAYKNDKRQKSYYKLDADDYSILATYSSLEELLTKEMRVFIDEYNLDGTRKHPIIYDFSKKYPIFAHVFTGVKIWEDEKEK